MNIFKPFSDTYIEVTIPLDEKMITAFEQSEQYAYLLKDFCRIRSSPVYNSVCCALTVVFDFKSMETFFSFNTISESYDGISCDTNVNIGLDPETAKYFKTEALKHLEWNFSAMRELPPKCQTSF